MFCFKLYGDFGQELYSIAQSNVGQSVYIGNDWISYIRYLFIMMNKTGGTRARARRQNSWFGGFLGNRSYHIVYEKKHPGGGGGQNNLLKDRGNSRKKRTRLPQLKKLTYKNKRYKYKLKDSVKARRRALDAGIKVERYKTKSSIRKAALSKKARLNVLRIYRKGRKPKECRILTKDMEYIDKKYKLGRTKNICRGTNKKSRRKRLNSRKKNRSGKLNSGKKNSKTNSRKKNRTVKR